MSIDPPEPIRQPIETQSQRCPACRQAQSYLMARRPKKPSFEDHSHFVSLELFAGMANRRIEYPVFRLML